MRPPEFYNHGVDTSLTIDHIARRLKALEFRIADAQETVAHGQTDRLLSSSPSKSRVMTPGSNRIDVESLYVSLEEQMSRMEKNNRALNSRVDGNEQAIKEIAKHITSIRAVGDENTAVKHTRSSPKCRRDICECHSECDVLKQELRRLKTKVGALSGSTSRACRSLSVGVSDSQHATLLLYSWAEKVHTAFGVVSHQLNIEGNVCPRPQLDNTSERERILDISAFLPHFPEEEM